MASHRIPRGLPFAGAALPLLPDRQLVLLACLRLPWRVRRAVFDELELRDGSDRSGPRLLPLVLP
jgi:hypothetical protein